MTDDKLANRPVGTLKVSPQVRVAVAEGLARLAVAYSKAYDQEESIARVQVFSDAMADLTPEAITAGFELAVQRIKFSPNPAETRECGIEIEEERMNEARWAADRIEREEERRREAESDRAKANRAALIASWTTGPTTDLVASVERFGAFVAERPSLAHACLAVATTSGDLHIRPRQATFAPFVAAFRPEVRSYAAKAFAGVTVVG